MSGRKITTYLGSLALACGVAAPGLSQQDGGACARDAPTASAGRRALVAALPTGEPGNPNSGLGYMTPTPTSDNNPPGIGHMTPTPTEENTPSGAGRALA